MPELLALITQIRHSRTAGRALVVVAVTGLVLFLSAQGRAWAAGGWSATGQTIPTVTPAVVTGTPVALPNGLDQPGTTAGPADGNLWALTVIPIGCILLVAALAFTLLGLAVWQRNRRRKGSA